MLVEFMNAYGSAHFGVGVALAILVLIPLRRGYFWARWAVLALGLPVLGATAWDSAHLAFTTGARTPWQTALVLLVLFLVGVALVNPKPAAQVATEAGGPWLARIVVAFTGGRSLAAIRWAATRNSAW